METAVKILQDCLDMAHASGSANLLNNVLNDFRLQGTVRNEQIALFFENKANSAQGKEATHWRSIGQKIRELGDQPLTPLKAASFIE